MTAEQERAADPGASAWVSASAGTGKTKVLVDRVLALLLAGVAPERILCLTFTKAAAAEMSQRIARDLGRWVTMTDAELGESLEKLSHAAPDPGSAEGFAEASAEARRRARRLFAGVLDVPGGMKIQTIHAFCQAVLKRFPLEAQLAPHFTVMDERDAAELMAEAQREVMARARSGAGEALARALAEAGAHANADEFGKLMAEVTKERPRLRRLLAGEALEAQAAHIRARLGLAEGETRETVLAPACAGDAFDAEGLRRAAEAMLEGGKTDRKRGRIIADWHAARSDRRARDIEAYFGAFFKDSGTGDRFKDLIFKDAAALCPEAPDVLAAEAARLDAVRERLRAVVVAAASEAVLRLGAAMLEIYERHKAGRALVDYDDLVLHCLDLLSSRSATAWVLYKLDGGIDHVLIDEAQDTNPEQWRIVEALANEFFAGEGAREAARTVFAVGDPKQSIYGFQRAAPEAFDVMRRRFAERVTAAGLRWQDLPLSRSFRSTSAVLSLVDAVFAEGPARDGVVSGDEVLAHQVHREGMAGLVELWPLAPPEEAEPAEGWAPPVEQRSGMAPPTRLAALIAARIRDWLDRGEPLESEGRPMRAGDIMVLVPRRGAFVEALVRALKDRAVPVAGVDRMVLTEQLAVMDLMALGRFLLLPEDDLTLATLLKSPLCGLSEEQLFALAWEREGSLWRALAERRDDAELNRVHGELSELLARTDFARPYELFAEVLGARRGRHRLLARLGPDAEDPIDEFMSLALAYERVHVPSLEGFLHWVEAGEAEIKRDLEQASRDEVRVLTVHGAKGLEAPVVFLPDTTRAVARAPKDRLLWAGDAAPLWPPRKQHEERVSALAQAEAAERRRREDRRLLYVAMTRAADRLYVCGWEGKHSPPEDCWYNLIAAGMARLGAGTFDFAAETPGGWPGPGRRHRVPQTAAVEPRHGPAEEGPFEPLPGWAREPAAPEPTPSRPLAPSRPEEEAPAVRSPLLDGAEAAPTDRGRRFRRGLLIQRLLQRLPEAPAGERRKLCRRFLERAASDLEATARAEIAEEVLAVVDSPDFAAFFGPGSRAEVPLAGRVGARVVAGQVDRLLVTGDAVRILDYKSLRPPPARPEDVPAVYLRQMAEYRALLQGVYPDRPVDCALLWTDGPRLMPLEEALLAAYAP